MFSALALYAQKHPKDATVWVTDDTHKVHSVSGNLLSEGPEVYRGAAPGDGGYRTASPVWDAASRTVKLFAGRNEFVSFQAVIEKGREDLPQGPAHLHRPAGHQGEDFRGFPDPAFQAALPGAGRGLFLERHRLGGLGNGRTGPGRSVLWTSTLTFPDEPSTLLELAGLTHSWLDEA